MALLGPTPGKKKWKCPSARATAFPPCHSSFLPRPKCHPGPHTDFDQLQRTRTRTQLLNTHPFSAPIKLFCEDTRTQMAGLASWSTWPHRRAPAEGVQRGGTGPGTRRSPWQHQMGHLARGSGGPTARGVRGKLPLQRGQARCRSRGFGLCNHLELPSPPCAMFQEGTGHLRWENSMLSTRF